VRLSLILLILSSAIACGGSSPSAPTAPPPPSAFSQTDLVVGSGTEAERGKFITVHYTLWIYDASKPDNKGTQVQSSFGGQPFGFTYGTGNVIAGWNQGFDGMKVGGRRRLIIPPALGYGAQGSSGGIPGNAGLVFELELLSVS
jgi:FKBP-type peptidyl-prolyl cis-trans isomerase FkpA